MKKIIGLIAIMAIFSAIAIAQTRFPRGISVATETQEIANGITGVGDCYVAGNAKVSGTMTVTGATVNTGAVTFSAMPVFGMTAIDVAVTSPTVAGQIGMTSAYVIYISSGTGKVAYWIKVGGQ